MTQSRKPRRSRWAGGDESTRYVQECLQALSPLACPGPPGGGEGPSLVPPVLGEQLR
jgi:hypothetical protein